MNERTPEAQRAYKDLRDFVDGFCFRHCEQITLSEYLEVLATVMTNEMRFVAGTRLLAATKANQ